MTPTGATDTRPARAVVLLGACAVLIVTCMLVGTPVPPLTSAKGLCLGFGPRGTMLWFELVASADELRAIFDQADGVRAALDAANRIDDLFIPAYTSFCGASLWFLWARVREARRGSPLAARALLFAGLSLCVLMALGDYVENCQLFRLTKLADADLDGPAAAHARSILWIFTRLKWGCLFVIGLPLAALLARLTWSGGGRGRLLLAAPALGFVAAAPLGLVAIACVQHRWLVAPAFSAFVASALATLAYAAVVWATARRAQGVDPG